MYIHINYLSNAIIKKYFTDILCMLIITDNTRQPVDYIGDLPKVNLDFANHHFQKHVFDHHFGCYGIVIKSAEPCAVLESVENGIKLTDERFNLRKYLIVPDEVWDDMMCVFNVSEIKYIDDILVVMPNAINDSIDVVDEEENETQVILDKFIKKYEKWNFDFLTHKYVGFDGHRDIIFLDRWFSGNSSFLTDNSLYPDKISDQQGREMRVSTMTYPPYSVPSTEDGTEMRMVTMYAAMHNMTIRMIVDDVLQWGSIENWTGTGLIGNVVMDIGDIGFAAVYPWLREYTYLDLTKSYLKAGVTCLAPAPRLLEGWLTPLHAFSTGLWVYVGIAFLFTIFAFFIITLFSVELKRVARILDDSILNTLAIFLVQSVPQTQILDNKTFKYTFGVAVLCSVLLSCSYNSGLASNMTIPRFVDEIDTVQRLVDSELDWGGTDIVFLYSLQNDSSENSKRLAEHYRIYNAEELRKLASTRTYAFAIERLPWGYYSIGDFIGEEEIKHLKPMKEDLYYGHVANVMKKSSVLIPTVDDLIRRIAESGILKLWEFEVVMDSMDANVQRVAIHSQNSNMPIKLKVGHLAGAFALLVAGLAVSKLIFLIEILFSLLK